LNRLPGATDDEAHGYPPGSLWLAPDGEVYVSKQANAGQAVWAAVSAPLPCDIAVTVLCAGTRILKTGYAGSAFQVIRASDGRARDIGFVNGELDTATLDPFCQETVCRVVTWYDQSGEANHLT